MKIDYRPVIEGKSPENSAENGGCASVYTYRFFFILPRCADFFLPTYLSFFFLHYFISLSPPMLFCIRSIRKRQVNNNSIDLCSVEVKLFTGVEGRVERLEGVREGEKNYCRRFDLVYSDKILWTNKLRCNRGYYPTRLFSGDIFFSLASCLRAEIIMRKFFQPTERVMR